MISSRKIQLNGNVFGSYFEDSLGAYHWNIEANAANGNVVSLGHGTADDESSAFEAIIAAYGALDAATVSRYA